MAKAKWGSAGQTSRTADRSLGAPCPSAPSSVHRSRARARPCVWEHTWPFPALPNPPPAPAVWGSGSGLFRVVSPLLSRCYVHGLSTGLFRRYTLRPTPVLQRRCSGTRKMHSTPTQWEPLQFRDAPTAGPMGAEALAAPSPTLFVFFSRWRALACTTRPVLRRIFIHAPCHSPAILNTLAPLACIRVRRFPREAPLFRPRSRSLLSFSRHNPRRLFLVSPTSSLLPFPSFTCSPSPLTRVSSLSLADAVTSGVQDGSALRKGVAAATTPRRATLAAGAGGRRDEKHHSRATQLRSYSG